MGVVERFLTPSTASGKLKYTVKRLISLITTEMISLVETKIRLHKILNSTFRKINAMSFACVDESFGSHLLESDKGA